MVFVVSKLFDIRFKPFSDKHFIQFDQLQPEPHAEKYDHHDLEQASEFERLGPNFSHERHERKLIFVRVCNARYGDSEEPQQKNTIALKFLNYDPLSPSANMD